MRQGFLGFKDDNKRRPKPLCDRIDKGDVSDIVFWTDGQVGQQIFNPRIDKHSVEDISGVPGWIKNMSNASNVSKK